MGRAAQYDHFDPQNYYSEEYFTGKHADGYANYVSTEPILRSEFRETLRQTQRFNIRRERLLEFGCAYGFFLDEARAYFESVHGIELAEHAVAFCQNRGLDVVKGVVDQTTLHGDYDVIVGLDVIEHVPAPQDTLALLASHMRPGALLVMTTGDWSSFVARWMGPAWRLMTPPQHLSFFTRTSMERMLHATGFEMRSLTYPWKRVPLSLITFQLQRILGLHPRTIARFGSIAVPMNLRDAMRVVAVRRT